ncbi:iron ABC transporter substrate-binding protein, partial [Burkholderia pseudomallei]
PAAAQLWMNSEMSDAGQARIAHGNVRPAEPGLALAPDVAAKMPNAPQVRALDVAMAAARKAEVDGLCSQAALGQ